MKHPDDFVMCGDKCDNGECTLDNRHVELGIPHVAEVMDTGAPRRLLVWYPPTCTGSRSNALGALVHHSWCPVHG